MIFTDCFHFQVMEYLTKPCKPLIRKEIEYSGFLKIVYTRNTLFKHKDVRKMFGKNLGFKPADVENIERECSDPSACQNCKVMVDSAYNEDLAKCQLDIVKALLRTQWHFKGQSKKRHNRIKKLLDDLGSYIEKTLEIVEDDW